jgi:hypothetical protein
MMAARVAKLQALGFAWEVSAAAISKRRSEGGRDNTRCREAQHTRCSAFTARFSNLVRQLRETGN